MGSKKRSARAREVEAFRAGLDAAGMGDLFAAEEARREELAEKRDQARRQRSCERKNRYGSRHEAELAARASEAHGAPKLFCYKCPYCGGWHLTHQRPRG